MQNILGPDVKNAYAAYQANRELQVELSELSENVDKKFDVMNTFGWPSLIAGIILTPLWIALWFASIQAFVIIWFALWAVAVLGTRILHPNALLFKNRAIGKLSLRINAAQREEKKLLSEYKDATLRALAIREDLKVKDQYHSGNSIRVIAPEKKEYTLKVIEGTPCYLSKDGELLTRNYDADTKTVVRANGEHGPLITLDNDTLDIIRNT